MTEGSVARRVKVYLVMKCSGEYEDYYERPVMGFQSRERAEECVRVKTERERVSAEVDSRNRLYTWHEYVRYEVQEVDVLLENDAGHEAQLLAAKLTTATYAACGTLKNTLKLLEES